MHLRLGLVSDAGPAGCTISWLDERETRPAQYGPSVKDRIKVRPRQLVAVDTAVEPPAVVWRWFRGVVLMRRDRYVVVDNHVYQPGLRAPLGLVHLPDILEVEVQVGDEVFYSLEPGGAVIDTVADGRPAHPVRIAADLLPIIAEIYAEREEV